MRRYALLLLLLLPAPSGAQPADSEPPIVGRPLQFSGVVGQYTLEVSAAPTTVHVEEPITLRVRLLGHGPEKYQPRRQQLHLFPADFEREFYIEPVPAEDNADPAKGVWEFVYRLRPKSEQVQSIGGLKLIYYDPARRKYQIAYQEADIPLTVTPRSAAREDWDVPSAPVPSSLTELAPAAEVFASPPAPLLSFALACIIGAPALCWLGALIYRRRHGPASSSHAHPAAQQALARLQNGAASVPWLVLADYLRARLAYPGQEPTPAEVAQFLRRRGVARPLYQRFRVFFEASDAVRFAPRSNGEAGRLGTEAQTLIQALEADPCLA